MQNRNTSSTALGRASTSVRRRSSGAPVFKSRADRISQGVDESFPSVQSLPTLAMPPESSGYTGPSLAQFARQMTKGGVPTEDESYRIYPSLHTSEDTENFGTTTRSHSGDATASHLKGNASDNPSDYIGSIEPRSEDLSSNHYYDLKSSGFNETSHVTLASSVDSGHSGLIASVGTTNKFTHRWPRPKAFKDVQVLPKGMKGDSQQEAGPNFFGVATLEQGKGVSAEYLAKWTVFKWCLLISALSVFAYGCAGLTSALMTWFNAWDKAEVVTVADNDILILLTLSGTLVLVTSCIGIAGTLLNSRPILALYTFLLWPSLLSLLSVGYTSYRRAHLALDHKLNFSWSRYYTVLGRQIIQDALGCCGYYSSMHEASPSKSCYLRTPLPGCKAKLFEFERTTLKAIWQTTFSVAPLHLMNIVIALLCANHVTNVWGKRVTPKQYRLTPNDVKADAEKLLGGSMYIGEGLEEDHIALLQKS